MWSFHLGSVLSARVTIVAFLAVLGSGASIVLGHRFPEMQYRWVMFGLWFVPLFLLLCLTVLPRTTSTADADRCSCAGILRAWSHVSCLMLGICSFSYVAWLSTYPYVALGDQVRDGALVGLEIYQGVRTRIFDNHWSQGLLFATLTSFVYGIVGSDVLMYRSIGALLGVSTMLLAYVGFGRQFGYVFSLIVSLTLGANGAVLYFARTEPLISWSLLLTVAAMVVAARVWRAASEELLELAIVSGALVGLALAAHASARVPVIGFLSVAWATTLLQLSRREMSCRQVILPILVGVLFVLVALGPQLRTLPLSFFLGTYRTRIGTIGSLWGAYLDALHVYIGASMRMQYVGQRLIDSPTALLLGLGALVTLVRGSALARGSLLLLLILPWTNSAMTDGALHANRMVVLVPFVAVVIASLSVLPGCKRSAMGCATVLTALCVISLNSAVRFFVLNQAVARDDNSGGIALGRAIRHVVEHMRANPRWQKAEEVVIFVRSGSRFEADLKLIHIDECLRFFLYPKTFKIRSVPYVRDASIYLSDSLSPPETEEQWPQVERCPKAGFFACRELPSPIYESPAMARSDARPEGDEAPKRF